MYNKDSIEYKKIIKVVDDSYLEYELHLTPTQAEIFFEEANRDDYTVYQRGGEFDIIGTPSAFINLSWWDDFVDKIYVTSVTGDTMVMECSVE